MKDYIALYILLLSFTVQSQDTTFNKLIYSYSGTSSIHSLIKNNNNYYACIGQVDTPYVPNVGLKVGIGMFKFNSNFDIIDSVMIYKPIVLNYGHGFDINVNDTSFIFCGVIKILPKENGYIVKFNKELDTLWTMQIPHPDTAYADTSSTAPLVALRDVKVTPSGDYIIVGNYNYHCQGNRNRSFIIKMDENGGIIWYRLINSNIYTNIITSIELETVDSSFYFISRKNSSLYLIKCNKYGIIQWDVPFNNYLSFANITEIKVIDNEVIVGSNYIILPFTNRSIGHLHVASINKQTHAINWSKKFYSITILSKWWDGETIDIEQTPSGNIVVGTVSKKQTATGFNMDIRANLLMLSNNGDSLWSHYYTYQNDSNTVEDMQFSDMVICDDGGILFGGNYYNFRESIFLRAWLVKTDSMGNAPGMFTVGLEEKNTLVIKKQKPLLYPNPATSNFNLRFEQSPKEDMQLSIFSASGALVKQERLSAFANEYRIDIGELSIGLYFVSLESNERIVFNSKFIKK